MIQVIIGIAKHLMVPVVAEGVETREMVEELTRLGVDFLQGYYFSRPIPEKDFVEYMKKSRSADDI